MINIATTSADFLAGNVDNCAIWEMSIQDLYDEVYPFESSTFVWCSYRSELPDQDDFDDYPKVEFVPLFKPLSFEEFQIIEIGDSVISYLDNFCEIENLNAQTFELRYKFQKLKRGRPKLPSYLKVGAFGLGPEIRSELLYVGDKLNSSVLRLAHLETIEVCNMILSRGLKIEGIYCPRVLYKEVYYSHPEYIDYTDYEDGWRELGEQEERKMDEETDGFWRIQNDLG